MLQSVIAHLKDKKSPTSYARRPTWSVEHIEVGRAAYEKAAQNLQAIGILGKKKAFGASFPIVQKSQTGMMRAFSLGQFETMEYSVMNKIFRMSAEIAVAATVCSTIVFSSTQTEALAAPNTRIHAVDVMVVIESDGATTVTNRVDFSVSNGPMTALIVENMALTPSEFGPAKYELAQSSSFSETIITEVGTKKYDIEATPKIPDGEAYLTFQYKGNMIEDGYIGLTTSEQHGEMYFFDWAPMQWVNAMKYRDVKIVLPVEVSGATISDREFLQIAGYARTDGLGSGSGDALILTDKSLNARNKIDYLGTDVGGGKYLLTMHVYQAAPSSQEAQRIQFYMKKSLVTFTADRMKVEGDDSFHSVNFGIGFGVGAILIVAGLGVCVMSGYRKRRDEEQEAAEKKYKVMDEMWEAPELEVGAFGVQGKVAQNLHPVEVGLLLGMEISQIIGILVQALGDQQKLVVRSLEPICAYPAAGSHFDDDIEREFVEIFDETGNIVTEKLNAFLEGVISRLQEKSWDCDMEATRRYYMGLMYDNPTESNREHLQYKYVDDRYISSPTRPDDCDDYYWQHRYYWRHYNGYYTNRYHYHHGLPSTYQMGYTEFLRSTSCFHGCFTQPNLENVCHSACHSACHDACHDACHSACHSACHDACHSACVSGGSR